MEQVKRIKLSDLIDNRENRKVVSGALKAIDEYLSSKYKPGLLSLFLTRMLNDNAGISRLHNEHPDNKKYLYCVYVANYLKFPFSLDFSIKDESAVNEASRTMERVLSIVRELAMLKGHYEESGETIKRIGDVVDYYSDIDKFIKKEKEDKKAAETFDEYLNDITEEMRRTIGGFKMLTQFFFSGDKDLMNERSYIFRQLSGVYLSAQRKLDWYSRRDYKLDEYTDLLNKHLTRFIDDVLESIRSKKEQDKECKNLLLLYLELRDTIKQFNIKIGNYFLFLKEKEDDE